jgi:hypothetical protein
VQFFNFSSLFGGMGVGTPGLMLARDGMARDFLVLGIFDIGS